MWQEELKNSLRTAKDLEKAGLVPVSEVEKLDRVFRKYKAVIPRYYASLIDPENPHCPIRLQAVPQEEELNDPPEAKQDPLSDLRHQKARRITHRYGNRVLLHLTSNCSMYCRYCFRKSLLNELSGELFQGELEEALAYLKSHPEVEEVIFSGGDPFLLTDGQIQNALQRLEAIPALSRIRFHTRVPVTLPSRVDETLVDVLRASRLPLVVVTHFNHPKEITPESSEALRFLIENCHWVLNQSVLLKGVNDSAEVLSDLMKKLFERKVVPYYLHHPDPAAGTSHFWISKEVGLRIYDQLRSQLPGYLVPRYVVDNVGAPYKEDVK